MRLKVSGYYGRLRLLLWVRLSQAVSVTPIITKPVDLDEAIVENRLCALHSAFGLVWRGKLNHCPLWVVLIGHL